MSASAGGVPPPSPSGAAPRGPSTRLADLAKGARARVTSVAGSPGTAQRLLEMGLTAGAVVEVVRFAPLGDPIEVSVRGYRLSLRREDAAGVLVEPS
jgi:Fe2+ transport system protein FeoA